MASSTTTAGTCSSRAGAAGGQGKKGQGTIAQSKDRQGDSFCQHSATGCNNSSQHHHQQQQQQQPHT
jgi:hypothetical protein